MSDTAEILYIEDSHNPNVIQLVFSGQLIDFCLIKNIVVGHDITQEYDVFMRKVKRGKIDVEDINNLISLTPHNTATGNEILLYYPRQFSTNRYIYATIMVKEILFIWSSNLKRWCFCNIIDPSDLTKTHTIRYLSVYHKKE